MIRQKQQNDELRASPSSAQNQKTQRGNPQERSNPPAFPNTNDQMSSIRNHLKENGVIQTMIDNKAIIFTAIDTFRKNPAMITQFGQNFSQGASSQGQSRLGQQTQSSPSKVKMWLIWALLSCLFYGLKFFIFCFEMLRNYGGFILLFVIAWIMYKIVS